jgi:FtsP/CotA-like multicopper oxidase with cupredoxin domain
MSCLRGSRREFLKLAGTVAGAGLVGSSIGFSEPDLVAAAQSQSAESRADYTIRIAASPIEIAHNRIVSGITYNGKFPGPLLRFKEGQPVVVNVFNDTETPEQLHWHGQFVPTDVDGAPEEGTPYILARGIRQFICRGRGSGSGKLHNSRGVLGECAVDRSSH